MISLLRLERKQKNSSSNSHISRSFLLIWNWKDKYVHTLRSSLENHTRFQTKMGKVYTRFQTKTLPDHVCNSHDLSVLQSIEKEKEKFDADHS